MRDSPTTGLILNGILGKEFKRNTIMKYSILIVDDEAAQRQFLSSVLQKIYTVEMANNGVEAINLLERRSFDLVITDERMPKMSGTELIQWLGKNSPRNPYHRPDGLWLHSDRC